MLDHYLNADFLRTASIHFIDLIIPGPSFAIVVRNSLLRGRAGGVFTAAGVTGSEMVHVIYTLLGFAVLYQTYPLLARAINWLGILYLIYLAIQSFRVKPMVRQDMSQSIEVHASRKSFFQGFIINLLNVRVALFYIMIFGNMVMANLSLEAQIMYLIWFAVVTFCWFAIVSLFFSNESVRHRFIGVSHYIEWGSGVLFLLCALWLARGGI